MAPPAGGTWRARGARAGWPPPVSRRTLRNAWAGGGRPGGRRRGGRTRSRSDEVMSGAMRVGGGGGSKGSRRERANERTDDGEGVERKSQELREKFPSLSLSLSLSRRRERHNLERGTRTRGRPHTPALSHHPRRRPAGERDRDLEGEDGDERGEPGRRPRCLGGDLDRPCRLSFLSFLSRFLSFLAAFRRSFLSRRRATLSAARAAATVAAAAAAASAASTPPPSASSGSPSLAAIAARSAARTAAASVGPCPPLVEGPPSPPPPPPLSCVYQCGSFAFAHRPTGALTEAPR